MLASSLYTMETILENVHETIDFNSRQVFAKTVI